MFKDHDGREFHLRMEERLSVQGGDGEGLESAVVKSPSGELTEARSGLRTGKKVSRAQLRFDRDQVWVAHRGQEVARYRRSYEQGVWLPPPNASILDGYREMIPAVLKQLRDPEYYVRRRLPPGVAEDPAESEVMTLVNVASVVVDAVWLASSLASVAWAEAKLA